jgi:four helix bundle protein
MAKTVDELLVYQKALAAAAEISALLEKPTFQRDLELRRQLNAASIRIPSDVAEGFEQRTDRHFARFLRDARGGCREICTQLTLALQRKYITDDEHARVSGLYTEIARMLRGLGDYLEESDWKDRQ